MCLSYNQLNILLVASDEYFAYIEFNIIPVKLPQTFPAFSVLNCNMDIILVCWFCILVINYLKLFVQ